jgi:nucleotide-binding universal stress UspA family protein
MAHAAGAPYGSCMARSRSSRGSQPTEEAQSARRPRVARLRRLICAVDASASSRLAVAQAAELAEPQAELIAAGVVDPAEAMHGGVHASSVLRDLRSQCRTALAEVSGAHAGIEAVALEGREVPALSGLAEERDADLIAVGSHGGSRAIGIVLGSVATGLVHRAPCPVLVARPAPGTFPQPILLASDGSEESWRAAGLVAAIAARARGPVVIVSVGDGDDPTEGAAEAQATWLAEEAGTEASVLVRDGEPSLRITETAELLQSGLVVIGSRGRTGLRALGSVSERVASEAGCSVLIARGPAAPR